MTGTPQLSDQQPQRTAVYRTDLVFHALLFTFINALMWLLDFMLSPEGIQWAHWITIGWSVGLVVHILAYLVYGDPDSRH